MNNTQITLIAIGLLLISGVAIAFAVKKSDTNQNTALEAGLFQNQYSGGIGALAGNLDLNTLVGLFGGGSVTAAAAAIPK